MPRRVRHVTGPIDWERPEDFVDDPDAPPVPIVVDPPEPEGGAVTVTIELGRAGGLSGQGYQLSINKVDERGVGHGYRIFGPKYIGDTILLRKTTLNERDAREIFGFIRPLLGDEWLAERLAEGEQ